MGQMTVGVLLGAKAPASLTDARFEAWEATLDHLSESRVERAIVDTPRGTQLYVGVWIASGSDEHGLNLLEHACRLNDFKKSKAYRKAYIEWQRFLAWWEHEGRKPIEWDLWLVPVEVA